MQQISLSRRRPAPVAPTSLVGARWRPVTRWRPPLHWLHWLHWLAALRHTPLAGTPLAGTHDEGRDHFDAVEGARQALPGAMTDFETFYRRHEREIFGYLWRMTRDEQTANDLTQEVFFRAWQQYEKVGVYDRPEAWLFRVATNLALNEQRHQQVAGPAAPLLGHERASGDHAAALVERAALRDALDHLPVRQRAAFILREAYGHTSDEIAELLGVSRAAAKMTLSRARESLRTLYLKEAGE